jgi:hypothetical protein
MVSLGRIGRYFDAAATVLGSAAPCASAPDALRSEMLGNVSRSIREARAAGRRPESACGHDEAALTLRLR